MKKVVLLFALVAAMIFAGSAGTAGAMFMPEVEAYFYNSTYWYQVCVAGMEGPYSDGLDGKIQSVEVGCDTNPDSAICPVADRKKIDCEWDEIEPGVYGYVDEENCCAFFKGGSTVSLKPIAGSGNKFAGFDPADLLPKKEGVGLTTTRITVLGDRLIKAFFVDDGQKFWFGALPVTDLNYDFVSIYKAKVTSTPAGINCYVDDEGYWDGDCRAKFAPGTSVRLNATGGAYTNRLYGFFNNVIMNDGNPFPYACSDMAYGCTFPINGWLLEPYIP